MSSFSLYYGSISRGDYKYGSDVDLLLILDYNFNCPRKAYKKLARWYTRVRERLEIEEGVKWGIQTAVNPSIYDLGSIKYGYVGMIESFWDHLRASAKPLWSREEIDIKDI
jgi:predicted nucleotidyltransferase